MDISLPRLPVPSLKKEDFFFENLNILCFGDVMVDRYLKGDISRISPEAPVPVFRLQEETVTLGGAGNVAAGITAYGAHVSLWGRIGQDKGGNDLQDLLTQNPLITSFLSRGSGPTTEKVRIISQGQHLLRMDQEEVKDLSHKEEIKILKDVQKSLLSSHVLVLSDYEKGFLTPSLCQALIQKARSASVPILVDPKGRDFSKYRGATVLTPNLHELTLALGNPLLSSEDLREAAQKLREDLHIQALVVTLGEQGLWVLTEQESFKMPSQARQVFDRVGAGDTVISTMAVGLAAGWDLFSSLFVANVAAGFVVEKRGTSVVTKEELLNELGIFLKGESLSSKIVTLSQVQFKVQEWKKQGLKIGFTNGCFDLFHEGHLKILQEARAVCDRLIVGVNRDTSVRRLKGKSRPVQEEKLRAHLVACQPFVDGVILFEDDTPEGLIHALAPHVLIKGSDYTLDQVVGADFVEKNGGHVVLVDLLPHMSTTLLLQRSSGHLRDLKKALNG